METQVPLDNIETSEAHGHFDIIDDKDPDVIAAKQKPYASWGKPYVESSRQPTPGHRRQWGQS